MQKRELRGLRLYLFSVTLLPQLGMAAVLASVAFFAYTSVRYNHFLLMLPGVVAFLAMLFLFLCAAVTYHAYTPRLWSNQVGALPNLEGRREIELQYRYGRKNTLTGARRVYVSQRERENGAPFLFLVAEGVLLCLIGGVRFLIEALLLSHSREREAAWVECRETMREKINAQGIKQFFRVPCVCLMALVACWLAFLPTLIHCRYFYSPNRLSFSISAYQEEESGTYRNSILTLQMQNKGKAVKRVAGVLSVEDGEGKLLYEKSLVFRADTMQPGAQVLERGASMTGTFYCYNLPASTAEFEPPSQERVFRFSVREIWYEGDKFIEFPSAKKVVIRPMG